MKSNEKIVDGGPASAAPENAGELVPVGAQGLELVAPASAAPENAGELVPVGAQVLELVAPAAAAGGEAGAGEDSEGEEEAIRGGFMEIVAYYINR